MYSYVNIGTNIKARRESLKMSQEELAVKSKVSRQTISSIETGKADNVKIGTLNAIASALETNLDVLFTDNV